MAPFTTLYPNGAATVGFSSPNDTMNHALVTGAVGRVKTCKNSMTGALTQQFGVYTGLDLAQDSLEG